MRGGWLLLAMLLALPAAGCATTDAVVAPVADTAPVVPPETQPGEFLAPAQPVAQTMTGTLKLKISANGRNFTALGALAMAQPDTVQLDVTGPLGLTMFVLRQSAEGLALIDYPHQSFLIARRDELPVQYRGWVDLWRIFPQLDPAVVQEAAWSRAGDTWTGIWGDPDGQNYRLTASAALGLTAVDFCQAAASAGTMTLSAADSVTRMPRKFRVLAPDLMVEGELLNCRWNEPVRFSPLRIPDGFTPARLAPAAENE